MDVIFSAHATEVMRERGIQPEWVLLTLQQPALQSADPHDSDVERFFRPIAEREDRVLRVVVNTTVTPWRVVSVFFDRGMRGQL